MAAVAADERLDVMADQSTFLGLGDALAAGGMLGSTLRAAVVDVLGEYTALARGAGAGTILILGTEPIRVAADGAEIGEAVEAATGLQIHVLGHDEEAFLTVIGVTRGRRLNRPTLFVDIGGGSTEFCVTGTDEGPTAIGLPLGCTTLTARHVTADPPHASEFLAMTRAAASILAGAPAFPGHEVIAVGGTPTNLVKVLPASMRGPSLTRARLRETRRILDAWGTASIVERREIRPARARLLPAGAAIMDALLAHYAIARVRVSDVGVREGALLAERRAGAAWRSRLAELARGWWV